MSELPDRENQADHWADLARKHKVRLPQTATKLSTGPMERWRKALGISNEEYREWTGGQSLKAFVQANRHWTLRAFVGLLLEYVEDRCQNQQSSTSSEKSAVASTSVSSKSSRRKNTSKELRLSPTTTSA